MKYYDDLLIKERPVFVSLWRSDVGGGSEDAAKLEGRNAPVVCASTRIIIRGHVVVHSLDVAAPLASREEEEGLWKFGRYLAGTISAITLTILLRGTE